MDIEREREAFEKAYSKLYGEIYDTTFIYYENIYRYQVPLVDFIWSIWQARAALQSQDREDALRYRFLKARQDIDDEDLEFAVVVNAHFDLFQSSQELEEAIDHARRIEGEGK